MRKKVKKYFKKYILDSPLTIKLVIGGILILLLSLNIAGSCSKNNFSCNVEYDPPEINQIKDVVK